MTKQQQKLIEWQRVLLSEAGSLAYRIASTEPLPRAFYDDIAFSLTQLAKRVQREVEERKP